MKRFAVCLYILMVTLYGCGKAEKQNNGDIENDGCFVDTTQCEGQWVYKCGEDRNWAPYTNCADKLQTCFEGNCVTANKDGDKEAERELERDADIEIEMENEKSQEEDADITDRHYCKLWGTDGKVCKMYSPCDANNRCPVDNESGTYTCINGACIWTTRECENEQQCYDWCKQALPRNAEICDKRNYRCEYNDCFSKNTCQIFDKCDINITCPKDNANFIYKCMNEICFSEMRECSNKQQCYDWCKQALPENAEICDNYNYDCLFNSVYNINTCQQTAKCDASTPCKDDINTKYSCINGSCIGTIRNCDSNQQCFERCLIAYPSMPAYCNGEKYTQICE